MSDLPGVPLKIVRDQLSAADRTGWLASSARPSWRTLSLPALGADRSPRFPMGRVAVPAAVLHTEVLRQHLLTAEGPGKGAWRLSGLTGVESAMRGKRGYEFAGS